MNANEMIERYVQEVGHHLPRRNKSDIQQELTSLVQDAVYERTDGEEPTAEQVAETLREFGKPEQIATQYHVQQYLIGPALFPFFRTVSSIVLSVIGVMQFLLLLMLLANSRSGDMLLPVWDWFWEAVRTLLITAAAVTGVFALLERYMGDHFAAEAKSGVPWDPYKLPQVDDRGRVRRGYVVAEVIGGAVALGIFIWLIVPDGILAGFVADSFRPVLTLLIASSLLDLVLKVLVALQNRWTRLLRWLEIGTDLFEIYVLYQVVTAEAITTIDGLSLLLKFGFGIALIVLIVTTIVNVGRLLLNWQTDERWDWRASLS